MLIYQRVDYTEWQVWHQESLQKKALPGNVEKNSSRILAKTFCFRWLWVNGSTHYEKLLAFVDYTNHIK